MPNGTGHTVRNMAVNVPFISNIPYYADVYIHPLFRADIDGGHYDIGGETKPFAKSLQTDVRVTATSVDIARYLSYLPLSARIGRVSGFLDLDITASYMLHESNPPTLYITGRTALRDFSVDGKDGAPVLRLPRLEMSLAHAELFSMDINIARLALASPDLTLARDAQGNINVLSLVSTGQQAKGQEQAPEAIPAKLRVDELTLNGGRVSITDRVPVKPFTTILDAVELRLTNFSSEKDRQADLSFSFDTPHKGRVSISGRAGVNPVFAAVDTTVRNVPLAPFQSYMPQGTSIVIEGGALSAVGRLSARWQEASGLSLAYAGRVSSTAFSCTDAGTGNRLVAWKSLSTEDLAASTGPLSVRAQELALAGFYMRLAINEDGTLNVQQIMKPAPGKKGDLRPTQKAGQAPEEQPQASSKSTLGRVEIGRVTLKEGVADFSDRYIKPPYSARVTHMTGGVSGLSSKTGAPARIDIKGQINNYAPVRVTGNVDLFQPETHADITATVSGLDLTSMSPYSSHFVGYTIQRGTLTLNAKYSLANKQLTASNRVGLGLFDLGQHVQSRPVIDLPIRIVISILRDREGNINLDIPVSGDLSSPHFAFGSAVLGAVKNVLEKIVTSPFSFLASLIGSSEKDLGWVEFDYGSPDVPPAAGKKLDLIAKAMGARPKMRTSVSGYSDVDADREALKQQRFLDLLREQKLKETPGGAQGPGALRRTDVTPAEYTKYLEKAYHAAKIDKPKNVLGFDKSLPAAQIEDILRKSITVTEQDCRSLALERAVNVRTALARREIAPDRLIVAETNPLNPPEKKASKEAASNSECRNRHTGRLLVLSGRLSFEAGQDRLDEDYCGYPGKRASSH